MKCFADFQATGFDCVDLGAKIGFDTGVETPVTGRVYDDRLYIEDITSWQDTGTLDPAKGKWLLTLGRDQWQSDVLVGLERRLYLWSLIDDGSDDAINDLVDLGLNAACKAIQDYIGQTDGGIAGAVFSGPTAIKDALYSYVRAEVRAA